MFKNLDVLSHARKKFRAFSVIQIATLGMKLPVALIRANASTDAPLLNMMRETANGHDQSHRAICP